MTGSGGLGGSGQIDRLIWPGQIKRLVGLGSEDLRRQGRIVGMPCVGERLGEIPLRETMLIAVVGNPAR